MTAYECFDIAINALNFLAIIGLAYFGFSMWKNQFKLSKKYEVAKNILDTANLIRIKFEDFQVPELSLVNLLEMNFQPETQELSPDIHKFISLYIDRYEKSSQELIEFSARIQNLEFEARTILGIDIKFFKEELTNAIRNYIAAIVFFKTHSEKEIFTIENEKDFIKHLQSFGIKIEKVGDSHPSEKFEGVRERLGKCLVDIEDMLEPFLNLNG